MKRAFNISADTTGSICVAIKHGATTYTLPDSVVESLTWTETYLGPGVWAVNIAVTTPTGPILGAGFQYKVYEASQTVEPLGRISNLCLGS